MPSFIDCLVKTVLILILVFSASGCTVVSKVKTMSVVSDHSKRVNGSCGNHSTRFMLIGRQNEAYIHANNKKLSFCSNTFENAGRLWGFILPIFPVWDAQIYEKSIWRKEMTIRNLSALDVSIVSVSLNGLLVEDNTICKNNYASNNTNSPCLGDSAKKTNENTVLKMNDYIHFKYDSSHSVELVLLFDDGEEMRVTLKPSSALSFWVLTV